MIGEWMDDRYGKFSNFMGRVLIALREVLFRYEKRNCDLL